MHEPLVFDIDMSESDCSVPVQMGQHQERVMRKFINEVLFGVFATMPSAIQPPRILAILTCPQRTLQMAHKVSLQLAFTGPCRPAACGGGVSHVYRVVVVCVCAKLC